MVAAQKMFWNRNVDTSFVPDSSIWPTQRILSVAPSMTGRVKRWRAYVWIMTSVRWADLSENNICVHEIIYNGPNLEFMHEITYAFHVAKKVLISHKVFTQGFQKPSISVQHYPGDIRKVWQPLSTQYTVRGDLCVCYSRLRRTHSSITFLCKFKVWKEQEKKKTEKTKRWWTEADSKSLRSQVKQLDVGLKRCALLCGWPIMSAVIQPNLM